MDHCWRRTVRTALTSLSLLAAVPVFAQAPQAPKAPREDLTIDPKTIMQSWEGDLDQMVQRRIVRVLVVPSKTFYFNDKGTQRGITYDAFQLVEQELQKQTDQDKKLKRKHLKVKLFYVPVSRDQILTALAEGKGDIAAANLTITPSREAMVDFTQPLLSDAREVVLTGPASPALSTLDDLAGKAVFVRKSSSYYEHLVALNTRFAAEQKPLIKLQEAPEEL